MRKTRQMEFNAGKCEIVQFNKQNLKKKRLRNCWDNVEPYNAQGSGYAWELFTEVLYMGAESS